MRTISLPDNQEDREVYLREVGAGEFVDALKKRKKTGDTLVQMLHPTWQTDIIYVALEYMQAEGDTLTLVVQDVGDKAAALTLKKLLRGDQSS
jgi:hypothetical protein